MPLPLNWETARKRAAGVVVLRRTSGVWRVLILRAFSNWDFPKGLIEPGESPLEAAIRETREEAGITDLRLEWGESFIDTEPYAGGKIARYFFAVSATGDVTLLVSPELGRPEHDEFRWATLDDAAPLLPARLAPVIGEARARLGSTETLRADESGSDGPSVA